MHIYGFMGFSIPLVTYPDKTDDYLSIFLLFNSLIVCPILLRYCEEMQFTMPTTRSLLSSPMTITDSVEILLEKIFSKKS